MYGSSVRVGGPLLALSLAGAHEVQGGSYLAEAVRSLASVSGIVVGLYLAVGVALAVVGITLRLRVRLGRPPELDRPTANTRCPVWLGWQPLEPELSPDRRSSVGAATAGTPQVRQPAELTELTA